jgi:hypothetical protein
MAGPIPLLKSLLAALVVTFIQLSVAVFVLAPAGNLSQRYLSLNQHDSFWFRNIVDRGYNTTFPPPDYKAVEIANVAFFPAYPGVAALLRNGLRISSDQALLITAQVAAFGFWSYFFLFCERWNLSPTLQFFGALLIVSHPAAFFLIAGYSEALFLVTLFGFIYWSSTEGARARAIAAAHGILMSATRLVGIACCVFPLVRSVLATGWNGLRDIGTWFRRHATAFLLMITAMSGALAFFAYCQFRWGHWNMYMLTQEASWGLQPDYFAVLRPSSYRWVLPALDYPTQVSQSAMTIGALLLVVIAICELLPAVRQSPNRPMRIGIYFCAMAIYYISVSGVACVNMESMLRYEFCVHVLIVLGVLSLLSRFRLPIWTRNVGAWSVVLFSAIGLSVQAWCIWNFTRGYWIA